MSKFLKKFFVSLLVSSLFLLNFVPRIYAAVPVPATNASTTPTTGPWYNQNFGQWSAKVFGGDQNEIFGERYTYAQVNWIINSLTAIVVGTNITQCIQAGSTGDLKAVGDCASKLAPANPSQDSTLKPKSSMSGSITGLAYLTGSLVAFRPASGVNYVKATASRLHVIPQAYAQTGAGYTTLSPIQSLWSVVRDISYALMVVIIIVMAFLIMFRAKISPQVVITVQSALPKIAIALILITFSYAIAGFLVDLMYVIIGAFAAMIKIGNMTISQGSLTYLFGQLNSLNGLVSLSIGITIFAILLAVLGGAIFGGSAAALVTSPILGVAFSGEGLIATVVILIFAVFLLIILFRLFWLMIRTAAVTVLLIIVGPIMILTETLGAGGGFLGWIRNLLANLAVYPTVAIMIFLSHYFFWAWAMGFITGNNVPLFGVNNPLNTYAINALNLNGTSGVVNLPGMPIGTSVLGFFLSFVILFLIPRAAHVIETTIQAKPVDVAGATQQGIAPLRAAATLGVAGAGARLITNRTQPGPERDAFNNILQNLLKQLGSR